MAVTYTNGGPQGLVRSVNSYVTRVTKVPELAAPELADIGADAMRKRIMLLNRIENGDMLGDVDSRSNRAGSAVFGWINRIQDYYYYQDHGTSRGVYPMDAVRDAREVVRGFMPEVIGKYMPRG